MRSRAPALNACACTVSGLVRSPLASTFTGTSLRVPRPLAFIISRVTSVPASKRLSSAEMLTGWVWVRKGSKGIDFFMCGPRSFRMRMWIGICPPSKRALRLEPDRAPAPFWPRPAVLPVPDPSPRPTRLRGRRLPGAGARLCSPMRSCPEFPGALTCPPLPLRGGGQREACRGTARSPRPARYARCDAVRASAACRAVSCSRRSSIGAGSPSACSSRGRLGLYGGRRRDRGRLCARLGLTGRRLAGGRRLLRCPVGRPAARGPIVGSERLGARGRRVAEAEDLADRQPPQLCYLLGGAQAAQPGNGGLDQVDR